jgi:glycosyltransferase involved in cell wall biosynthesis
LNNVILHSLEKAIQLFSQVILSASIRLTKLFTAQAVKITSDKLKLNLCSIGDPADPLTWSGTPYNLYSELYRRGQSGEVFNAEVSLTLKRFISLLSWGVYGRNDIGRAPFRRYIYALNSAIKTNKAESSHTLHTGTLSLPFWVKPKNQAHYLFCDTTWDLWSQMTTNIGNYSERMIHLAEKLEKRAYSQIDHFFPTASYVKENLTEHYGVPGEKITVVGTGLGIIKPFTGQKDYSSKKILFAAKGRFRDKGGDLVVKAFQEALTLDPQLELTIVGCKEAKAIYKSPNLKVLDFVPLQELQHLFNTHSIFLMPALNEPWGLVYLEAMACKMPIVGLNRNAFPEISSHGKYGFGIDEANPSALARTLVEAFQDLEKLKEMGEQAQSYCLSNFSWKKTVDQILQVIEKKDLSNE